MKSVRYHGYGDSSVLRHEDADKPRPARDQVLVQVAATTFNPIDVGIRVGALQQVFAIQFPHTPGIDVAGAVAELGDGVDGLTDGDPVVGFLPLDQDGAAADFVLAPAAVLTSARTASPSARGDRHDGDRIGGRRPAQHPSPQPVRAQRRRPARRARPTGRRR